MHAMNHPFTRHLCESVWDVDPVEVAGGRHVSVLWLSPDCKHFSKAKGSKPVSKKIRGLAWVALRWAAKVLPDSIYLENVEEFQTWGPLKMRVVDGEEKWFPDPAKKGVTFKSFVRQLRAHGYKVDWREMRACDFGAPTIRKRLFLVARRDGFPIVFPEPTHGHPNSPEVRAGLRQPYRTAAECIDWSIPCPSIFERPRPLVEATMRRIAKGIMRYVIDANDPFVVDMTVTGGEPRSTSGLPGGDLGSDEQRAQMVADLLRQYAANDADVGGQADLFSNHGDSGSDGGDIKIGAPFLAKHYGGHESPGWPLEKPISTITTQDHHGLVVAHLTKFRTGSVGSDLADPVPTITAGPKENPAGAPHALGVVTAKLEQVQPAARRKLAKNEAPETMVTSNLVKLRGTSTAAATNAPIGTISAQGTHHAEVRAFLIKYYGTDQDPRLGEPLHTVTTKHRYALVTIRGQLYQIVDIGLRMLEPHELFAAQGFPESYIIHEIPDPELLFAGQQQAEVDVLSIPRIRLTKSAQVRMCGNSVCPPMSAALIRANAPHERHFGGRLAA
jgi:DNA (cytosine-5)-methyltransferase 1